MTTKETKVGERLRAMCPECERETAHVATSIDDQGEIDKIRCTVCSTVHATDAPDGDAEDAADDVEDDDLEDEDEEEEAADEAPVESGASAIAAGDVEGEEAEEEAEVEDAEDEDDEENPLAAAAKGVARAAVVADPDEEEDDEDEEEDEEEEDDAEEEDSAEEGFGRPVTRSAFETVDEPVDDEESEGPKKKKKRKAPVRKKASSKTAPARSWSADLETLDASRVRAYDLKETYKNDEVIRHVKFGVGRVVEVLGPQKISVLFKEGQKMMLQGQR